MHKKLPRVFIFLDEFDHQIFNKHNTNIGIIYRNYKSLSKNREIFKIAKFCKEKRYKLFISNDIKLALKVKADGVYIPSFNKTHINVNNLGNKKLLIIGSAHNQIQIKNKINQKCEAIFLSPIFPISKAKNYLGIHKFNLLSRQNNISIFALGGINENNFSKLKITKIEGFGGISIFKKKPAYKRPVFLKNNFF